MLEHYPFKILKNIESQSVPDEVKEGGAQAEADWTKKKQDLILAFSQAGVSVAEFLADFEETKQSYANYLQLRKLKEDHLVESRKSFISWIKLCALFHGKHEAEIKAAGARTEELLLKIEPFFTSLSSIFKK